ERPGADFLAAGKDLERQLSAGRRTPDLRRQRPSELAPAESGRGGRRTTDRPAADTAAARGPCQGRAQPGWSLPRRRRRRRAHGIGCEPARRGGAEPAPASECRQYCPQPGWSLGGHEWLARGQRRDLECPKRREG